MISPKALVSSTPRKLSLAKLQNIPQEQSFLVKSSSSRQFQNHSRRVSQNQVTSPQQKECKTLLELYKQMNMDESPNGLKSERTTIKIKSPTQQSLTNLKPFTYQTKEQPLIIKHIVVSRQKKLNQKSNSCMRKGQKFKRHVEFKNSIKIVNLGDGKISKGKLNDGVKPLLRYQKTRILIEDL